MTPLIVTIIQFIVGFLFMARFLLQACRVDFYNPLSQGIVRATDPILKPVRSVIPGYRNLDVASFVVGWLAEVLVLAAVYLLAQGYIADVGRMLFDALIVFVLIAIRIFWGAIIIVIIASFIAPSGYSPGLALLQQITEPLLAPARRIIPPLGGLDFSPIVVFLLLTLVESFLLRL